MIVPLWFKFHDSIGVCRFLGVFFQVLFRQPAFHTASSFIGHDETYGNIECLIDNLCEEIACSRSFTHGLWRNFLPFCRLGVPLWFYTHHRWNLHKMHSFILICVDNLFIIAFHGTVAETLYRHLHIRLSGTNPHFTHKHILEGYDISVVESDGIRRVTGSRSLYFYDEIAIF